MKRFLPVAFCVFFGVGAITVAADTYATRDADAPYTNILHTEQIVRIPLIEAVAITPQIEIPAMPTAHEVALAALETEHRCLSEVLYYEARGEGAVGQEAVAEVVFNRLRDRAYPHSICGIVYQGSEAHTCQFAFACDGERNQPRTASEWASAETLAAQILTGQTRLGGLTGDALYFRAAGQALEPDGLVRTIQIGNQVFFRDAPKSRAS
ncbi:MAG TPA: cell wall hydrolase [Rhizomicrobium sp.]|nr:cell wall hydrolase [Rhizomicrobium sp.]